VSERRKYHNPDAAHDASTRRTGGARPAPGKTTLTDGLRAPAAPSAAEAPGPIGGDKRAGVGSVTAGPWEVDRGLLDAMGMLDADAGAGTFSTMESLLLPSEHDGGVGAPRCSMPDDFRVSLREVHSCLDAAEQALLRWRKAATATEADAARSDLDRTMEAARTAFRAIEQAATNEDEAWHAGNVRDEIVGLERQVGDVERQRDPQGACTANDGNHPADVTTPLPDGARATFESAAGSDLADVRLHTGPTSEALTTDRGARALTIGRDIHFAPGELDTGTPQGMHLLAHETAHVIQGEAMAAKPRDVTSPGSPVEVEADQFADAVVAGAQPPPLREGTGAAIARKEESAEPAKDSPDLPAGVPYRWIPGTYAVLARRSWLASAPDFQEGAAWVVPSRSREILGHLRQQGMFGWAPTDVLARAAERLAIRPGHGEVFTVNLGVSVFDTVGLPPGTHAVVGRYGDGLEVVTAVPDVAGQMDDEFVLSEAHKRQLLDALERFTGMPIEPGLRARVLTTEVTGTLGAGTSHFALNRAGCDEWFGADAYAAWLERPRQPGLTSFDASAEAKAYGELTPEEVARVQAWLAANLPADGTTPLTLTRPVLEAIDRIETHPEREQILALLRDKGPGAANERQLDRAIHEAEFEAQRRAAGLDAGERVGSESDAAPIYDVPLPARLDQTAGLVVSGEQVTFSVIIDWPADFVRDEAFSEYRWRRFQASVEWVFERTRPDGSFDREIRKPSPLDGDDALSATHSFQLGDGEEEGIWNVSAFVRNSHFQPACVPTTVVVKTETKRLAELRHDAFADLGQPGTTDDDYDFATSATNELFGEHGYDHGKRFRGELPADFERRTLEERGALLTQEIERTEKLIEYLQNGLPGQHPEAIEAAQHHLRALRDTQKSIATDSDAGWQPFEIRGTYLGISNAIPDGSLDVLGSVRAKPFTVEVRIRDLSRRLEANNYVFDADGVTFEQALEQAFLALCKEYPKGKLSILAEGFDAKAQRPTGQTVGFELDTQTWGEDVKEKVFDPAVSVAVNVASAMVMIFAPATIPVLMPLTIAYNEAQNIDELVHAWENGTLTWEGGMLSAAQIGLDLLPLLSRARSLQTSVKAFWMLEGFDLFANGFVMTLQAKQAIERLRDNDIQQVAAIYEELVKLEREHHASDATMPAKRAELTKQLNEGIERARQRSLEVVGEVIKNAGLVVLPVRGAVLAERSFRTGRLGQLASEGSFHAQDGVAPHYDPQRGRIVGDEAQMNTSMIERLVAEQQAHLRGVGDRLAERLRVPPDRIDLRPGEELAIWDDGKAIQIRYVPGVDPERAFARWATQAEASGIASRQGGATTSRTERQGDGSPPADREPRSPDADSDLRTASAPDRTVDAGDLVGVHQATTARGDQVSPIHYDPATNSAFFETTTGDGGARRAVRVAAPLDPRIATASELLTATNRVVGRPIRNLAAAHDVMRQLTQGELDALAKVGIDVPPGTALDDDIEFGLGRTSTGEYIVVRGENAAVDWARLPGVEPIAHTHPSTIGNDLQPDAAGERRVTIDQLLEDTPDPLIPRELVFPSAADVSVMARLGIEEHRVFTSYVLRDGFVMKPAAGDDSPRLEFVIERAHEVGHVSPDGPQAKRAVYKAIVTAEAKGTEVFRKEVWAIERRGGGGHISMREPDKLEARASVGVATPTKTEAPTAAQRATIVAELGEIPVVAKSPDIVPPGGSPHVQLHGSTYYVAEDAAEQMLDRLRRLPEVQVHDYQRGFIVRHADAEWYFERLSPSALEDYRTALRSVARERTGDAVDAGASLGLPPPNAATIEIWAFRGVREIDGRLSGVWTVEESKEVKSMTDRQPLLGAGHVGISFDGGRTIYGFVPDTNEPIEKVMDKLKAHRAYPGKLQDDTELFRLAEQLANDQKWNTAPVRVDELVDPERKREIRDEVARILGGGTHDHGYSFPLEAPKAGQHFEGSDGYRPDQISNCAVFPSKLGLPIPDPGGNMRQYVPKLQEWANMPTPVDARTPEGESP